MRYLHYKFNAGPEKALKVSLNGEATVRLLDTLNYYKYSAGKSYASTAEHRNVTAVILQIPHKSQWHVLVEHGDFSGELRATVDVLSI